MYRYLSPASPLLLPVAAVARRLNFIVFAGRLTCITLLPVAAIAGCLTGKYVLLLPVARHFIAFAGCLTGKRLSMCHECTNYRC